MKYFIITTSLILYLLTGYSQSFSNPDYYIVNDISVGSNKVPSNMVTQSLSQIIESETSVSCNNNGVHYENSYYRVFDLFNDFNLNGNCYIDSIEVGIALANSATSENSQPLYVKFYALSIYSGNDVLIESDSLTQLGELVIASVQDSEAGSHKMINIIDKTQVLVVEGKHLVVEILMPDIGLSHSMYIGSNNNGQTGKTYIRAPECGVNNPTDVADILFPEMMLVLNIYWEYQSPVPEIQSFEFEGQLIQTVINNDPDFTIEIVMPTEMSLESIVPEISIPAGFQIIPASGVAQDFSVGPVTYDVNNNFTKVSQTWDVYVTNAGPDIISATLPESNGKIIVDKDSYTVSIPVDFGEDLTTLSPSFDMYQGFVINPPSGSEQDFLLGPVTYTVSHETLSLTQDWDISVFEAIAGIKEMNSRRLNIFPNPTKGIINLTEIGLSKIEIYNIYGSLIKSEYNTLIDISDRTDGIYFIKVFAEGNIYSEKIILKK